jgi:transcription elongation factor Elf1
MYSQTTANSDFRIYQSDRIYNCPSCNEKFWSVDSYAIKGKSRIFGMKCLKCEESVKVTSDNLIKHFMVV